MVNKPAPKWQRIYAIPGMLIFGTCTVVTQKLLFSQSSKGLEKYGDHGVHDFRKPWFQTDLMFCGMMLSLIAYLILGRKDKKAQEINEEPVPIKNRIKFYLGCSLPAICDLCATSLSNVQLLYINASVWQMLRGSMVIFSSLFCAFILKRPHYPYMWWSILGVVIALTIVGIACVMSTGAGVAGVSQSKTIMAIFLVIVAQLIQATQLVIEDFILHDCDTHPLQLVGLKGTWGFIFCTSIAMPTVQFLGGDEGNGVHEDIVDTFTMIGNNTFILTFVVLYCLFILFYNVGGMLVINVYSAVHRTILEGLRTVCIWIVQLIIFYTTGNYKLGEEWNAWSLMQLAGFFLLFTSTLMYNKILRLPFFKYPDEPLKETQESINSQPLLTQNKDEE
ncbi:putative integral membrane protein [Histomonas meleagridis]|uniref:putative integral membrane protein n=1 Tax=Histomonas meleagridis TaxID=135588 RepID=UPI003559CC7F|nr:putative integral membrane protein [Histomonas meleagridis]KAH0800432.1 putative integral membrane protein [Histomonas meleagridis]